MINYQLIVQCCLKYGIHVYLSFTLNETPMNNYIQFHFSIDNLDEIICILFDVLFTVNKEFTFTCLEFN